MASQHVVLNLRIPSLTLKPPNESPRRVDNSEVRFRRTIEVASIGKPGDVLDVSIGEAILKCTVNSVHWNEHENMFVVACQAKPPMREADYRALLASPDWEMRALL